MRLTLVKCLLIALMYHYISLAWLSPHWWFYESTPVTDARQFYLFSAVASSTVSYPANPPEPSNFRHCQSNLAHTLLQLLFDQSHYHTPPQPWIYPSSCGFPLSGCVMIFMWFYNWILRLQGVRWPNWVQCRSKQPLSTATSDFSLNDSYSTDPPPTKWKRKKSVPSSRQRLLLMFGLLNSVALGSASPFELSSDLSHLSTLRRMRSCQGELRTNKLNNHDLAIVQRHLRESGDQFLHATGHNNNVLLGCEVCVKVLAPGMASGPGLVVPRVVVLLIPGQRCKAAGLSVMHD